MKYKITIFTPTYNRAHTLERLYKSLQAQSFKDFEWLVIDDGSSDGTKTLFEKWKSEENFFPIHYFFKTNGGKHSAINCGLDKAKGELFFTADSDDYLTNNALQKITGWANTLPVDEKFAGVVGNWGSTPNETVNTIFNGKYRDASLLERYPEMTDVPIDGERAFVFFTAIHRRYRYPEFENENFMTEAVAWNRMAYDGYKMRVYNDIIYVYKFLPKGLTLSGSKIFIDNPKGYGLWLKEKAAFCNYSVGKKIIMYYSYFSTQNKRISSKEIANNIGTTRYVISVLAILYALKNFYNLKIKKIFR